MNRVAEAAVLGLLLAAAGCAVTGPRPRLDPGVELAPVWRTSPAETTERAAAITLAEPWWDVFGDPVLDSLIREALERNYDLAAAAARVDAARARARIAGADRLPSSDASLDASRSRQNFIGIPIPGAGEQVLSSTTTSVGASLNVSWEIDLWGRIRASRLASSRELDAAAADLAGAGLSLAGQVAKTWFAVAEAAEQSELASATLDNRSATLRYVDRRYRAGLRGALDLRLARSNEARARDNLADRRRAHATLIRQLEVLLGRTPGDEAPVRSGILTAPPPALPPYLPSEIVARRPDLAALEIRLAAAGHRVAEAKARLYPSLRLTGSTGRRSEELGDLASGDFSVWNVAGNLLQPIFQGGRLRAGADLARADFEEATALYAGAVLRALAEVESSLAAETYLEDRVEALHAERREAEAARALAEERYRTGVGEFLDVLEAQQRAFEAQSRLLAARRARLDVRVDLVLSLGGGYQNPDSEILTRLDEAARRGERP